MFVNKDFTCISQKRKGVIMRNFRQIIFYAKTKILTYFHICSSLPLTLSRRRPISYRNQSIDLQSKSTDWFLYDIGLHRERVKSYLRAVEYTIFDFLIMSTLTRLFSKTLYKNYHFLIQISKIHFKM